MEGLNPRSRSDRFGKKINRDHSPVLAWSIPWLTIVLGSLSPLLPIIASAPLLPPMGFIMLIAWRLVHPGLLPLWAGVPLGLIDDLFSGQPFGSAIMLWSLALLGIEAVEARFPWRGFLQDWLMASAVMTIYLAFGAVLSGTGEGFMQLPLIVPQLLLSVMLFPIIGRMVASLDRLRLTRIRIIS